MMNKAFLAAPLVTSILMAGCSGNSSSSSINNSAYIEPAQIDKTISELEWDDNNRLEMASHAYRSIALNSLLASMYSGQSAVITTFITLVQGSRTRDCNLSGSIEAELASLQCTNGSDEVVNCDTANDIVKTSLEQSAVFYRCQDGVVSASYFDGALTVDSTTDLSTADVRTVATRISAQAEIKKLDDRGEFVRDENGDIERIQSTDYLQQTELVTFFLSRDLILETQFDDSADRYSGLEACTTAPTDDSTGTAIPLAEALKTNGADKFAVLQGDSPYLPYVEFNNLNLGRSFSNHRCEGTELVYDSSAFDLTADNVASAAMGDNTQFFWRDLVIPSDQKNVEGTLMLTHNNPSGSASPTTNINLNFNGDETVTIDGTVTLTLSELLAYSAKPVEVE